VPHSGIRSARILWLGPTYAKRRLSPKVGPYGFDITPFLYYNLITMRTNLNSQNARSRKDSTNPNPIELKELPSSSTEAHWIRKALKEEPFNRILKEFNRYIGENIHYFILGGFIRDVLIRNILSIEVKRHDLDIVVDLDEELYLKISQLSGKLSRTPFGGFRWFPINSPIYVDIWSIANNYNVKRFGLRPDISNVLRGVPFNLGRICFDMRKHNIFDGGCLEGIKSQQILYNPQQEYLPHIQAVRAIGLYRKTGFSFDASVYQLLRRKDWQTKKKNAERYLISNLKSSRDVTKTFSILNRMV